MEDNLTFTVKRVNKNNRDKTITVSAEVYEALRYFSSEANVPIKMLADALLRFGMDNIRIVYDDGGEVS